MSADNDTLGLIHKALAEQFLDLLTNGIPEVKFDKEGNETTTTRKPTAAEYSVVVAFLKANSITASVEENDALAMLKAKMEEKRKQRPAYSDPLDMAARH